MKRKFLAIGLFALSIFAFEQNALAKQKPNHSRQTRQPIAEVVNPYQSSLEDAEKRMAFIDKIKAGKVQSIYDDYEAYMFNDYICFLLTSDDCYTELPRDEVERIIYNARLKDRQDKWREEHPGEDFPRNLADGLQEPIEQHEMSEDERQQMKGYEGLIH